jgi:hypothetical protein
LKYFGLLLISIVFCSCFVSKNEYATILSENEKLIKENTELHEILDHYISRSKQLVNTRWKNSRGDAIINFGETSYADSSSWGIYAGEYVINGDTIIFYQDKNIEKTGAIIGDKITAFGTEYFLVK